MFNENKAWQLHYHGHIIGCVRFMPSNRLNDGNPMLLLAVFLAKVYRSDQQVCADVIHMINHVIFDQRWRKRYHVTIAYDFDYFTVSDAIAKAKDAKQWFGGTVLLDSSGVPLF